jgi:hypothetical protein
MTNNVNIIVTGTNMRQANKLIKAYVFNQHTTYSGFDHYNKDQVFDDVLYNLNIVLTSC